MLQLLPFRNNLHDGTINRALFYASKFCGAAATSYLLMEHGGKQEGGTARTAREGRGRFGADVKQCALFPLQHPRETSEV